MFLTCLVPGPSNPKAKIDVYLQPLIDDLQRLWKDGILTYDISSKENFVMRAYLMWTINDFPAYGMLSGWTTQGKLACPYCMEDTKAFTLERGGKIHGLIVIADFYQQTIHLEEVNGALEKTMMRKTVRLRCYLEMMYGKLFVIIQK
jgi:hypothetical protein